MSVYVCKIDFGDKGDGKHCLICPLRDAIDDDSCRLQEKKDFKNWKKQMEKCPLVLSN